MVYQFTIYSSIFAINSTVSLSAAMFLWQRRRTTSPITLFYLMLAAAEWSMAIALEAAAVEPGLKTLFSKFEYIGYNCTVALLLIFALQYTQKDKWLKPIWLMLYWVTPVITILLAATNEWHHLIWTGFSGIDPETNLRQYYHGTWFWVNIVSVYMYTAITTILFIRKAIHIPAIYKRQIGILLIGVMAPWIGSLVYIFGLSPIPELNTAPITFTITGLCIIYGIFRYQLLDLVPIARASLIDIMNEGVLVIDNHMRIVDCNPAAQDLLNLPTSCIGLDVDIVMAAWPEFGEIYHQSTNSQKEILLNPETPLYVDVRVSNFKISGDNSVGKLIVFSNITKLYKAVVTLFDVNEELQKQYDAIAALQAQLKEQAISDALTGLLNRHHLQETLPKEVSRAKRGKYPIAVIMLDVDSFKQINDIYGHDAGDMLLLGLGDIIRKQTRFEDFPYRYGGEEFLLVLPGLNTSIALERAEQIRQSFENYKLIYDSILISTTLSAGVATYPQHGEKYENILHAADKALYAAKAAGRNCVRGFNDN